MKHSEIIRAWNDVAANIDDARWVMSCVAFTTGFLAGGDNPYGAALVMALAEKAYGHHPDLNLTKWKMGLAGPVEASTVEAVREAD
jgi:hypothetical protein